jgi:hypothetical protein
MSKDLQNRLNHPSTHLLDNVRCSSDNQIRSTKSETNSNDPNPNDQNAFTGFSSIALYARTEIPGCPGGAEDCSPKRHSRIQTRWCLQRLETTTWETGFPWLGRPRPRSLLSAQTPWARTPKPRERTSCVRNQMQKFLRIGIQGGARHLTRQSEEVEGTESNEITTNSVSNLIAQSGTYSFLLFTKFTY